MKSIKKITLYLSFLSLFLMNACTKPIPKKDWEKVYFSVEDLIKKQEEILKEDSSLIVKKEIEFGTTKEIVFDSLINWEQELSVYASSDINKPILIGLYDVTEEKISSTESKTTYRTTSSDLVVQKLTVTSNNGNPTKVVVNQTTENFLYKTQRTLTLKLKENQLITYQVQEAQKLLFRDPVEYQLTAQLSYE